MKRKWILGIIAALAVASVAVGGMQDWGYSAGDANFLIQDSLDALDDRTSGDAVQTNASITTLGAGTAGIGTLTITNGLEADGLVGEEDFVVDGTAGLNARRTATYHLTAADFVAGSNAMTGKAIPDNAIVDYGLIDWQTVMDSTNAAFEFSISLQAESDLRITTTGEVSLGLGALIPVGTPATGIKMTGARVPWITCGEGNATGTVGATLILDYHVTQ